MLPLPRGMGTRAWWRFELYAFWWPPYRWRWGLRRLNRFGPPPRAVALGIGPLRVVYWYRDREEAA